MENLASNMAKVIVSTQNGSDSIQKQILHFIQDDKITQAAAKNLFHPTLDKSLTADEKESILPQ